MQILLDKSSLTISRLAKVINTLNNGFAGRTKIKEDRVIGGHPFMVLEIPVTGFDPVSPLLIRIGNIMKDLETDVKVD